jgi:short-subunit dehydrogenase
VKAAGAEEARFSELAAKNLVTPPEECAADIIKGIRKGNRRIITGNKSTSMFWMGRLFPNSYPTLLKKLV